MKTWGFKHFAFIYIGFLTVLFGSRAVYCHVIDIDYFGPEAHFQVEGDGRNFFEWLADEEAREERRDAWISETAAEIGWEFAGCFDPRLGERD